MAWDIYGNTLRRGYCEVHPNVHEEYPCSLCESESRRHQPQQQYQQYPDEPETNIKILFINQMEKTSLEKQIQARAEKRFNEEYEAFVSIAKSNAIFKEMKIEKRKLFGYGGFFESRAEDCNKEMTNFEESKLKVIAKFIEEDTKNILSKLESLNYLFNS